MQYEIFQDIANMWRWRLVKDGTNIIAVSGEGHHTKGYCELEIQWVKGSVDAPVVEVDS